MKIQMRRRYVLFILSLLFLFGFAFYAPASQAQDAAWQASYWNNRNLSGEPVLQRQEENINHNWGQSSPHELVNEDEFSARWVRTINFAAGTYRFTATMDDGMRVWVDNVPLIDVWYDSQVHSVSADTFLTAGNHQVRVEYYEAGGGAIAQLNWQLISTVQGNWLARYYNNMNLSGEPVRVQNETQIALNASGSPAPGVNPDQFSVSWTQDLSLNPGRYRFTVMADDGVRLWVNNRLVLDEWRDQSARTFTAEVDVPGGPTPVRLEYYENLGGAVAQLGWTQISSLPPTTPALNVWRGEYYNNTALSGTPALVRNDPQINFIWGSSSPAPNVVSADRFSVRWTQTLNLSPGRYQLTLYADDGIRFWAGSRLLVDAWEVQPVTAYNATIDHTGGALPLVIEFFENTGLAEARLVWATTPTSPTSPTAPPPPVGDNMAVMTGANYLNVRSGPGMDNEPFSALSRGQVVPMVGRDRFGIWILVQLPDGQTGWVSGRYLTSNTPFASLPIAN